MFYLATAPRFFSEVAQRLGSAGLLTSPRIFRRVVIEKPFGTDLASAEALNASLLKVMSEKQIYRIDHYLGKETVQNILVSRFSNGLFEAFWNNHYIDHVQITAAETVGVETRGNFMTAPAPCATWCPTTCSSCWRWWPWSRRRRSAPMRCVARRPR
jgi:glucose-6-phosphate 1-dehydrogenase